MEWLTSNLFFLVILILCIGMHLFGHGGHGSQGNSGRRDRDAQRTTRANSERH